MAYIDFRESLPPAETAVPQPTPKHRTVSFLALGITALIVGLLFILAFVALREPVVATMVTVLLLLPVASLFGGSGRPR